MPTSIRYRNTLCYSFKQIDEEHRAPKGTAFRAFKRGLHDLVEQVDFFYLDATAESDVIESLRAQGAIYRSTQHLVLLTERGRRRLAESGRG